MVPAYISRLAIQTGVEPEAQTLKCIFAIDPRALDQQSCSSLSPSLIALLYPGYSCKPTQYSTSTLCTS